MIRGAYKISENNPIRNDETKVMYCPPQQVESEMDKLVDIYNQLEEDKVAPVLIAAWVHHAFTMTHPFQDGNGRMARLLASLIFIKHKLFPLTVLRERREDYIIALEKADSDEPQPLVNYFAEVQKLNIQKALNLEEVTSNSFDEIQNIFAERVKKLKIIKEKII